jgi:glycosyltransferase involved in cell wall biosynthesis
MNEPVVSIIMPYYNRIDKIKKTLDSFQHFYGNIKNIEVVVVDDGSSKYHKLDNLITKYTFSIKLINLHMKSKPTEVNPCYPYNVGVKHSIGNIIILSSPETFHTSNMFEVTNNFEKLNDNSYLLLSTFCCTNSNIIDMITNNNYELSNDIKNLFISKLGEGTFSNGVKRPDFNNEYGSWYLHSKYKKSGLNFFTCLTRNLYYKLCGFDEKYRYGTGYDDNEFLERLKSIVPETNFVYYDNAISIHIDHEIVHDLPPTLNEHIYNKKQLYVPNNNWGIVKNRKKRIGILCSFGIGGADKVTETLTRHFVQRYSDTFEFVLFYNDMCFHLPSVCDIKKNRIINYNFCNLVKIKNTSDLINYNLDLFIVHRGGNEHWLLKDFENISFDFKILEINFHGDVETKCDHRICPSEELLVKLVNNGFCRNKITLIPNPISSQLTGDKLNICENKFVFGRIARNDLEIYSCVNLVAYKQIEDDSTMFLYINPHPQAKKDAEILKIKNIIFLEGSVNSTEVSKIYNTFDVLCHSNILGETFGNTIGEAIAHGKPAISHEGYSNNVWPQSHIIFFKECDELFIKNNINPSYQFNREERDRHVYEFIAPKYAENMNNLKNDVAYYNKIIQIQTNNTEAFSLETVLKEYIETFHKILQI